MREGTELGGQGKCYCNHSGQSPQGLSQHNSGSKPDSFIET